MLRADVIVPILQMKKRVQRFQVTCSRVELRLASRSSPKLRLFSPNCIVIWDKKINDRNEIEMETRLISLMGVVPSFVNLLMGVVQSFVNTVDQKK